MADIEGGVDGFPWSIDVLTKGVPLSIRDLVGRSIRVVEHGHVVTQEYVPGRVTIYRTEEGRIRSISIEADSKDKK